MGIKLGDRVKDKISGFKGIATGRVHYLFGCVRFIVQAETIGKEEKIEEGVVIDEYQLEVIKKRVIVNPLNPHPDEIHGEAMDRISDLDDDLSHKKNKKKRRRAPGGPMKMPRTHRLDHVLRNRTKL